MYVNFFFNTRFSDRVLVEHKQTRSLLSQFAHKVLSDSEVNQLSRLCEQHALFLKDLIQYLVMKGMEGSRCQCPPEWAEFIDALVSSSAVCSIIHPSEKLFDTLLGLEPGKQINSIEILEYLQYQVPVLFELVRRLKIVSNFLPPIIKEMMKKSKAPFMATDSNNESSNLSLNKPEQEELSYFPNLPKIRSCGSYVADRVTRVKLCTKRRIGHPTLPPGIFTFYCEHGNFCVDSPTCRMQ